MLRMMCNAFVFGQSLGNSPLSSFLTLWAVAVDDAAAVAAVATIQLDSTMISNNVTLLLFFIFSETFLVGCCRLKRSKGEEEKAI